MMTHVNAIFGKNLRLLCTERGTISEAARQIDVTRVQLARFFNGESYPKPAQLARICQLYGVDARIMTEPLDQIRAKKRSEARAVTSADSSLVEFFKPYVFQDVPVPQGIHVVYRQAFSMPDVFVVMPLLVKKDNLFTRLKGFDLSGLGVRRSEAIPFHQRTFTGCALPTNDGMVMHFFGTGNLPFLSTAHFISNTYYAATGVFRGTIELFRPPVPGEKRRVPVVLQVLRQSSGVILEHARRSGLRYVDDLPERHRKFLVSPITT